MHYFGGEVSESLNSMLYCYSSCILKNMNVDYHIFALNGFLTNSWYWQDRQRYKESLELLNQEEA